MIICKICKQDKDTSAYYLNRSTINGNVYSYFGNTCKECLKIKNRKPKKIIQYDAHIKPYLNKCLNDLPGERWVDVFGLEDSFMVSSLGRVKGKHRLTRCGRYWVDEKILTNVFCGDNKQIATAHMNDKKYPITRIVVSSFLRKSIDEIFADPCVCVHHKNFDYTDNRLDNLELKRFKQVHKKAYTWGLSHPEIAAAISRVKTLQRTDELNIYSAGVLVGRVCNKCLEQLPIKEFQWDTVNRRECKRCSNIRHGVVDIGRNKRFVELKKAGLKKCYGCGEIKSHNDFHKQSAQCKECKKKRYLY